MKNGAMRGSKRRYEQKGNGGFLKEKRDLDQIESNCLDNFDFKKFEHTHIKCIQGKVAKSKYNFLFIGN
ncbi:hypothetical protein PVK06_037081 [Gossypium arboreum]|uniref:Uncharacterized protein n=1 Tax=Gossypium arboreum TaxID=29729 RepID=A0ABR0MW96_GOSAR|nr:hypothetical protein PVK06_037081 [Gossypium arboreum]